MGCSSTTQDGACATAQADFSQQALRPPQAAFRGRDAEHVQTLYRLRGIFALEVKCGGSPIVSRRGAA
jgi:hypothetical protein